MLPRVSEIACLGRAKAAVMNLIKAEASERREANKLREAAEATVLLGSNEPLEAQRAAIVLEKQEVDAECKRLKDEIGRAKAVAATRGVFLPVSTFRSLETRLSRAQTRSQALQVELGRLRRAIKAKNIEWEAEKGNSL